MFGLYIHIPFCNHVCSYCDFYKMVVSNTLKKKTIDYIIKEMDIRDISKYNFDTVYIGGGSPSSLNGDLLDYFLFNLSKRVNLLSLKEFTMEFNPDDITIEKVKIISKYHISRVSIGVQSFNKKNIKVLGRIPFVNKNEIMDKINLLKRYKINNINLDLIYAIPSETLDDLKTDLKEFISLDVNHISCYSLILEEHTILNYEVKQGHHVLVDEALDEKMYVCINDILKENNFQQYETSNYAKKGYKSLHNQIYWLNDNYLGIGPAASSHIDQYRFTNIDKLEKYFKGIDEKKFVYREYCIEKIDEQMETSLMLGLRMNEGIDVNYFYQKYEKKLTVVYPKILNLINEKLLVYENNHIFIPPKYSYIANHIIVKILS